MPKDRGAIWSLWVLLIVALKAALGLIAFGSGWVAGLTVGGMGVPSAVFAVQALGFGALGLLLLLGNLNDPRARSLGATFILIASPLTDILLRRYAPPVWFNTVSLTLRPDAFIPAFLWVFLRDFPSPLTSRVRSIVESVIALSVVVGAFLFLANCSFAVWPGGGEPPWIRFRSLLAAFVAPATYYWAIVFVLSVPVLPLLIARAHSAPFEQRRRMNLFAAGLLIGCVPISIEVLLETLSPAYSAFTDRPTVRPVFAALLFTTLAVAPVVTTYSVLVDRVMDIKVVLRAAAQYALARYTIVSLTLLPFASLAFYVYRHREERVSALMAGPRPLVLVLATLGGIATLRLRPRVVSALDRRFFREHYDSMQVLARLAREGLRAGDLEELEARLAQEIERALHVDSVALLTVDASGASLQSASGQIRPLTRASGLVLLAGGATSPFDVELDDPLSPLQRLPDEERGWLSDGRFRLLLPLQDRAGEFLGMLALSQKRSGLRYSTEDRELLSGVAASVALAIENHRLRSTPPEGTDEPASECLQCHRLRAASDKICECGSPLGPASVPRTLRGIYRFDQRLGAGGMGVVYRATDMGLGRQVAIKTLPRVTPERATQLRREAQAMASINHAHLAVIYGVETWRGVPLIVEELLLGGTLANRLLAKSLSPADAIDCGVALADVLEHLHGVGLVHCDVKPSNIGFTEKGVVKLLDFGLARLVRGLAQDAPTDATTRSDADSATREQTGILTSWSVDQRFVGTPLYMSPEAVRCEKTSPSFDLWGLTVVLYEAMTGRVPFAGDTLTDVFQRILHVPAADIREFCPECSMEMAGFFADGLAIDRRKRPATASHVKRKLIQLQRGLTQG